VRVAAGTRLGSYEIVAPLGAGGMGEVYRAHDVRLNRDVAVKVLPDTLAADADALGRFEREARALAALSHPNILAIYDFGSERGLAYAVTELLEGETLRSKLETSTLSPRKAIDYAVQIAHALAAAHDKGIVHRDLKPENVFVTRDGRVKVLDFGLARLTAPTVPPWGEGQTQLETRDGIVLGTVGYMSPEQVRGVAADHRSDIFSCGVVLYEMLTGRRPFGRDSAVETMNAILKEDPPAIQISDGSVGAALRRVTEHCLEKQPEERFQSARDLAFDLETLRASSDPGAMTRVGARAPRRLSPLIAAMIAVVAMAIGAVAGRLFWRPEPSATGSPTFTQLTYEKGTIWSGRFAPDGKSIVYAAAWDGGPIRMFLSRTDRAGSTSLNLPNASLFAISPSGEMAISLNHAFEGWMGAGTLARVQLLGSGPRPVAEQVREADWTPDGNELAIVRRVNGRERLEFPVGKTLYETNGYISHIRVSRDGQRVAFADHPFYADDNGDIAVVDRSGARKTLASGFLGLRGVVWSPDGSEVWFTATNSPDSGVSMRAARLDGETRTVLSLPTDWRILDVATDGRLLMTGELVARHVELRHDGNPQPQELGGMIEQGIGSGLSDDGKSVLITDQGGTAGSSYATYLRHPDQPAPIRLGDGQALGFSPDGRSVLSIVFGPPSRLLLLPIGAGQVRELPNPDRLTISVAAYMPDGKQVMFLGSQGTAPLKGYVQSIDDGSQRIFTSEGVTTSSFSSLPIARDGTAAWLLDADGRPYLFPLTGGDPRPLTGVLPNENFVMWSEDGRSLYVSSPTGVPQQIWRVDLATGARTLWKEVSPSQPAGVRLSQLTVTPDGKTILHSYAQLLTNLYVVEGVRTP
jgi:serine/threonine protein kinase